MTRSQYCRRSHRNWLNSHHATGAVIGFAVSVTALASDHVGSHPRSSLQENDTTLFSIPATTLDEAISEFISATDWQVGFPSELTQGVRSPGVTGRYSPREALSRLLAGTGLGYRMTAPKTLTLEKSPTAAQIADTNGNPTLPRVTVTSHAVYDQDDPRNEQYTVTRSFAATKTQTPIMETPASIQVVPRAVMEDQKASRITDALENVSGVRAQSSLGTSTGFIIRGFRNPLIYRNGLMAVPNTFRSEFDTSNLQSVEVLKGPASMLFGRIDPGGLINVTTKKPLDAPYYSLEQRFGSYDFYRTEWDAGGNITSDKSLLYRFSGAYQSSGSFRDFVSNDRVLVYPSVTWRPSEATDLTLNVEGVDQDYQADYGIPAVGKRPANIPVSREFGDPNDPMDSLSKVQVGTEVNHRFNADWAVHNRFLAAFGQGQETFLNPAPAFGNALNEVTGLLQRNVFYQRYDNETYNTNLDLTGQIEAGPTRHQVLVGFDYLQSYSRYRTQGYYDAANPALSINIYDPYPSYGIPSSVFHDAVLQTEFTPNFSSFKDEWWGIYFQDHITLWDKLHILGGGRYDWIESGRGRGDSFSQSDYALDHSKPTVMRKDDGFNPRVGILYEALNWLSIYGNWTNSMGASNGISSTNKPFKAQTGEQFEAGVKTSFFENRLLATLAYYHLTKDGLLTPDLSTPDPSDSVAIGQQRSQGIELDVTGQLTDTFSVIGSYAYTDARVTHDNRSLNGVVGGYVGNRLPNVPEHSASLWLKYELNGFGANDGWSLGVGGVLAGQREGDLENTFQLPGYVRLDAFAAYKMKVGPTRVTTQFNIRNVLDKTYYESTDPDANVTPRLGIYPGAPLTAMGSIRVEY